jgi:hypothetical protein
VIDLHRYEEYRCGLDKTGPQWEYSEDDFEDLEDDYEDPVDQETL